jgi:hypothetical protein
MLFLIYFSEFCPSMAMAFSEAMVVVLLFRVLDDLSTDLRFDYPLHLDACWTAALLAIFLERVGFYGGTWLSVN